MLRLPARFRLSTILGTLTVVAALLTVSAPQMAAAVPSADAGRVAFAVTAGVVSHLWTMNTDGSDPELLPGQPAGSNSDPASSPDGTRIAFTSIQAGNSDVWVIDLAGTNLAQLTSSSGSDLAPAWSADGSRIAFQSDRSGNSDVWLMNPDGSGVAQVTRNPAKDGQPAWFPSGSRIAFQSNRTGNNDIYTISSDGTGVVHVTTSTAPDTQPSVAPSGTSIAFTSRRSSNTDVYTAPIGGGSSTRRTTNGAVDKQPAFSTDGRFLAFTSTRSGTAQIWKVPRPSGTSVQLTTGVNPAAGADWMPYAYPSTSWAKRFSATALDNSPNALARSADGSRVFVTGGEADSTGSPVEGFVLAYNSSGTQLWSKQFTGAGSGVGASYAVAVSPDGSKVYVAGFADFALHVASYNTTTGALINSHDRVLQTYAAAYAITVSPDGTKVYVAGTDYGSNGQAFEAITMALNSSLTELWTKTIAGGDPIASSIHLSPSGDTLYWTGTKYGSPFADQTKYNYLTVAYRTSDGNLNWSQLYDGPAANDDEASSLGLSPDGSKVYVTGLSAGAGGANYDVATVAYSAADGAEQWVNRYDSPTHGFDYANSVAVSPDGSTVYTGGARSRTVTAGRTFDFLTTSMDATDGSLNWASFYNGPGDSTGSDGNDQVSTIQVAPGGSRVYVTGNSYRAGTSFDMTSVAYDTAGNQVWLGRYNGPENGNDFGYDEVLSPDGSTLYATGSSRGTTNWDAATVAWHVGTCGAC